MEMTGNKRKAIRHASATATRIRCPLELQAGLPQIVQNIIKRAERINQTKLSANSKFLQRAFRKPSCSPADLFLIRAEILRRVKTGALAFVYYF
jgi:hypothetical protein